MLLNEGDVGYSWGPRMGNAICEEAAQFRGRGGRSTPHSPAGACTSLYVSTDGGESFQIAMDFQVDAGTPAFVFPAELLGFALSPDGSQVYVGTQQQGLWVAPRESMAFRQVNRGLRVNCLASRQTRAGTELWACSDERSGFVFGKSVDDGVTFTPMMPTVTSMSGPIACSPKVTSGACFTDANASVCTCPAYQQFCSDTEPTNACIGCGQDGAPPPDAGGLAETGSGGGGGSDAGRGGRVPSGPNASCGCSVVGGGGAAGALAGCAITVIALARRPRRVHADRAPPRNKRSR